MLSANALNVLSVSAVIFVKEEVFTVTRAFSQNLEGPVSPEFVGGDGGGHVVPVGNLTPGVGGWSMGGGCHSVGS